MGIGIVTTIYGPLQGVEFDGAYSGITEFRGIPYAAPPVGALRWMPPQNPAPWSSVRLCDTYGPAAVQIFLNDRHAKEYYSNGLPPMSEDCLYLNLTTGAAAPGEKRPVFMWFHGGGLTNCFSYEQQFNPQELARKGVIVVTVGQRLSLFGYLALPQLTAEQGGRSGNYGFMDQLKALEWVVQNAEAFGGDPQNITVGGQSGGCLKAAAMAATAASHGQVKRVISQSGLKAECRFRTLASAEQQGQDYLRYGHIDPNIALNTLRNMDVETLFWDVPRAIMPGEMICDADLVPFITLREGIDRFAGDVDFLSGSNYGEADVFANSQAGLGSEPVRGFISTIQTRTDFYRHFRNLLGKLYDKYSFEELVSVEDETAYRTARHLAGLGLAGSEGMNFSRNVMLNRLFGERRKKLEHQGATFTYYWTHLEPYRQQEVGTVLDPEILLAWHSSELWFTFASLREGVPPTRPWRKLDYDVAHRMSSYWANFMRCGNPNGEGLPYWPASDETGGWAELGSEVLAHGRESTGLEALLREFVTLEYNL